MKTSEILRAAKAVIEDPERWTQGMYARRSNNDGEPLMGYDPSATCWCSVGALQKVVGHDDVFAHERLLGDVARELVGNIVTNAVYYNDHRTHAEVMGMWDKAIALAESEENAED